MIGLTPEEEGDVLRSLQPRLIRPVQPAEEELVAIDLVPDRDDQIMPGGPIALKTITPERSLSSPMRCRRASCWRTTNAKSRACWTRSSRSRGSSPRTAAPAPAAHHFKQIGNALLVQQRVAGRVAVTDKPDVLWDRPDLERLYARLEDEYELKERADALFRKLSVIADTARSLERHSRHQALVSPGNDHRHSDCRRTPGRGLSDIAAQRCPG